MKREKGGEQCGKCPHNSKAKNSAPTAEEMEKEQAKRGKRPASPAKQQGGDHAAPPAKAMKLPEHVEPTKMPPPRRSGSGPSMWNP